MDLQVRYGGFRVEPQHPKSIQEAVDLLLTELPEEDQQAIRIMAEVQLFSLHFSLGNLSVTALDYGGIM